MNSELIEPMVVPKVEAGKQADAPEGELIKQRINYDNYQRVNGQIFSYMMMLWNAYTGNNHYSPNDYRKLFKCKGSMLKSHSLHRVSLSKMLLFLLYLFLLLTVHIYCSLLLHTHMLIGHSCGGCRNTCIKCKAFVLSSNMAVRWHKKCNKQRCQPSATEKSILRRKTPNFLT